MLRQDRANSWVFYGVSSPRVSAQRSPVPLVARRSASWGGSPQQKKVKAHDYTRIKSSQAKFFGHVQNIAKAHRCNAAPWIEGQTSGKRLTINTRPIHDPLDSRKFEASASVFIVNEHAYIKVPYDPRSTLLCHIDKLSGSVIGEAFCEMHRTEFRRIFHALCDYHEGAEAIEKPF